MPVSVGELLAYLRLDSSGFDRGIRVAQTEMRTATGTADRMGAAVGVTGERLTGAGRAAQVAASGSAKYRAAQLSLVAAQERYNTVLNQGDASTAKLASAEASVIRANERVAASSRAATTAVSELGAAQESGNAIAATTPGLMGRTASGFARAGKSAIGLGVAFGAFALAMKSIKAIKAGVAFESDMTRLVTAAGEAKSALGGVSAGVLSISRSTGVSAKELAAAAYVIESAGYHQANGMQTVLKAAAQGAQIEGAAVKEVSNALSSLLVDYHMKATDAATVTSQLVTAVGHGKTTFAQLATALPNVAAAAAALNVTLPETAAAIATITMHGTDAAKAGTYLRQVLGQLGGGGSAKARKVMQGLGIDANELSMTLTSGSGHGLLDAITMLQDGIAKHLTPAGLVAIDTFKKSAGSASDYQKMLANLPPSLTTTFGALTAMTGGVKSMQGFLQLGGENLKTYAANTKAVASATADASGNVKEWGTASQTARVRGERLSAMFNAAAITVTQKLMPPLKAAEGWLADKLPAAVHTLQAILGPTASIIGTVFVGAWHALSAVLSVVGGALSGVGGFLQHHKVLVTTVATAVLAMWAAYKTYRIGVAAIKAIDIALGALAMRMSRMGGAMAGARGGMAGLSVASVAGSVALLGVGAVIGAVTYKMQQHAASVAQAKAATADYVGVLQQTKGAINDQIIAMTTQKLAESGAYDAARKYGISLNDVTQAALGNVAAHDRIAAATHNSYDATKRVLLPTLGLGFALKDASDQYNTATSQTKANTTATKHGASAATSAAAAAAANAAHQKQVATAEQAAADAAKRLDTALQALSGRLGARQALDQFRQGMQQLASNLDKSNHSLRGNSAAAVANRLAVDNVVQSALQYGDALKAQGKTQPQINSALQKQIGYLIDNAKQLGLNKRELVGYLKQLHLTPSQIHTLMGVDDADARAKIRAMQAWFNSLTWTAHVSANGQDVTAGPGQFKARASATGGYIAGPGTGTSDSIPAMLSNGEYVVNAKQTRRHRKLLEAVNSGQGYASGGSVTLNPHSFQTSLGRDASSEQYAFQQVLAIGTKAGISSGIAKHLTAENRALMGAITDRNRLADKLKAANQLLADAQKKLADEAAAVRGAITGSFDITTAGTGFDGQQPITGRNMLAQERQAANRARAFVGAIKRLKGKIGAGYLYQLAEKGPDALPEAQALLSLNRSDLKAFNSAAGALNTSGNQLGSYIGNVRFGGEVRRDAATVAAEKARLHAENKSIDRLGNRIVKQLENGIKHLSNPHLTVYLDGKKLATAVAQGAKKNGVRN